MLGSRGAALKLFDEVRAAMKTVRNGKERPIGFSASVEPYASQAGASRAIGNRPPPALV